MKWNVSNAVNRDVERQQLNAILKEIQQAIEDLNRLQSTTASGDIRDVVGKMVEGNKEVGVEVTYDQNNKVLDFAVSSYLFRLRGDVEGQVEVLPGNAVVINTTLVQEFDIIPEPPDNNRAYWRKFGEWEQVPSLVRDLALLDGEGFMVHVFNPILGKQEVLSREITVAAGELTVADGDGVAGNPLLGLADVTPAVGGTMKTLLFDDKGRRVEEDEATTDDLPEGLINLYFTDERAQDAVGTILGTTDDVALAYNDVTPEITATLPSKGQPDGLATLDSGGKLVVTQLPNLAITDTFVVASEAAMLALAAEQGDVAVRTDEEKSYILTAEPASTLANWQELLTPTGTGGTVTSVDIANATGISFSGGPITSSGTFTPVLSANLQAWHSLTTSSKANSSLTIGTTAPLGGGGDLSANRTLTISAATSGAAGSMSAADKAKLDSVDFGTYTPTVTGVTNVAASTAFPLQYLRVGNVVQVGGNIAVQATAGAGTQTRVGISLPIASAFATVDQLGGAGAATQGTTAYQPVTIRPDTTNARADLFFYATSTTNGRVYFTLTYLIV